MTNEFYAIKKQHLVLVLGMVGIAAVLSMSAILAFPVQTALSDHTPDDVDCNTIPCVHTADIVDGQVKTADLGASAVTSGKIKDGGVKSADIAPDAVTADELAGVSKLIFAECSVFSNTAITPGSLFSFSCSVPGTASGDKVVVSQNSVNACFGVTAVRPTAADIVSVSIRNVCTFNATPGTMPVSIIVYDT